MCFGSKTKNLHDQAPPRPAPGVAPQQPTYAPEPKRASVPSSYQTQLQSQAQQHHHQGSSSQSYNHPPAAPLPQQQHPAPAQQHFIAELPDNSPAELMAHSKDNDYAPPPGPPPSHQHPVSSSNEFAPPPGPPPSHSRSDYAPPPGPPPFQSNNPFLSSSSSNDYAPPPGPPPSQDYTAPPPGPPPAPSSSKPKQHDWESLIPDTALFPPPPSFFSGFDRSPATNSTEAEAEAGEAWCRQHPLSPPTSLPPDAVNALNLHNPRLMEPAGFHGQLRYLDQGRWSVSTSPNAPDSCIIAYPPLYSVPMHSPLSQSHPPRRTIYFEVSVLSSSTPEITLSIGFTALPYPSFRQPGWHRGSLAVHGDDGHKFINDRWGGKTFTAPFRLRERYGIGMTFSNVNGRVETEVFFTRNGIESGRWNLHEETDAEGDLPVTGLEGYHDLSCAVGTFGGLSAEVYLDPAKWSFVPEGYKR
ncbi:hypothetical protein QBC42DRAFT_268583 [Cladorrhinum samala]|uniref:SPRY domain-containing protein n=1 Tax=Cladorrhinum samala TaxID=585594 RepID=A0AAV9HMR9_9PEZI|nr:hypothetical protein QBC42DRAFT_268583 [Cladorrhinum samala]